MTTTTVPAGVGAPRRLPFHLSLAVCAAIYLVLGGFAAFIGASDDTAPLAPRTSTTSTLDLFWHNFGVLGWLALGLCTAGLLTGGVLGLNAIMVGWVIGKQIAAGDTHSLLTGLLPHFPLEIGAYVISAAASMRLGVEAVAWFRARRTAPPLRWQGWLTWQGAAVVLLFLAAIVEANVSHV